MSWFIKTCQKEDIWESIKKHGPTGRVWVDDPHGRIIGYWPKGHEKWHEYEKRQKFVNEFGWSIPSKEIILKIKEYVGNDSVLEVGAGKGLWTKLMRDAGINIIATDIEEQPKAFTNIEIMDGIKAVQQYSSCNVLMFNWPPYKATWPTAALEYFKGSKVIYIGEGNNGCTASNCFHDLLNKNFQLIEQNLDEEEIPENIPNWEQVYDKVFLYIRK